MILCVMDVLTSKPLIFFAGTSFLLFVLTPLLIPLVIRSMRRDYFLRSSDREVKRSFSRTVLYMIWHIIKNLLGVVFVAAGFVMLFLPGQGILTILVGIILLDFPGKHRFINRLASGRRIRTGLNWIRKKTGRPPFLFIQKTDGEETA